MENNSFDMNNRRKLPVGVQEKCLSLHDVNN